MRGLRKQRQEFWAILLVWFGALFQDSAAENPLLDLGQAPAYFQEFVQEYGRHYRTEQEKQRRYEVFMQNLVLINQKNLENDFAVYGIGPFTDLTSEEFMQTHSCLSEYTEDPLCDVVKDVETRNAPDSFDWRTKQVVTGVKNQDDCGSCWAFSATGNIEAQHALKYGQLVPLSEQQLVDCDTRSKGCSGGFMTYAFRSLIEMGGSMNETDYEYTATEGQCSFDGSKVQTKLVGCKQYHIEDEDKLKEILHQTGPISIACASFDMQHYNGGVMPTCKKWPIDHGVLLVGYGTENGVPFWIIKNSWNNTWGEKGYARIRRGENACGIMSSPMASAVIG